MNTYTTAAALVAGLAVLFWSFGSGITTWRADLEAGFDVGKVVAQAHSVTSRSWEYGTLVEALLELENRELGVFGRQPFPGGQVPKVQNPANVSGLVVARNVIWTNDTDFLIDGEGSPADPASLGVGALLLSHDEPNYMAAAKRQAEYLVTKATRFRLNETHSAISHRHSRPELWADFVYMVPPFLAYYGVATQDLAYLEEAVRQCQLYDQVLSTNVLLPNGQTCPGLWRHIVSDPDKQKPGSRRSDPGVWLTSNAWAVAGMTRVLATLTKWQPPPVSSVDQDEYQEFVNRARSALMAIVGGMLHCVTTQARDETTGLLMNYLDGPGSVSAAYAYGDAAGTALMTSAVYRLAVLSPELYGIPRYLEWAETNFEALTRHVNSEGIVSPVADVSHIPSKHAVTQTSEGQSMVILMYSARRDCVDAGVCVGRPWSWEIFVRRIRQYWA